MILATPFLTEIDPQVAIKGSRDPLGIQPIWTGLGRHVVGNLTTVSASVRDFTVTLLGYYFAERVAEQGDGDGDLGVFLRWEQLAAYARGEINGDWEFRGTERTRKNLQDGGRVRLGTDSTALILSDQKTYGLWGLYTVPSRSSGFVAGEPTRLTPEVRKFVEVNYLSPLSEKGRSDASSLIATLSRKSLDLRPRDKDRPLLKSVGQILRKKLFSREQEFYRLHLVEGGPDDRTQGGQRLLAEAMKSTYPVDDWSLTPAGVRHLAKQCRTLGVRGRDVADCLERIRVAELLVAPAARLFALLLGCDGQIPSNVAVAVRKQWGPKLATIDPEAVEAIRGELGDTPDDPAAGERWVRVAHALAMGNYADAIALVMEQNRTVMLARGGAAPWVETRDGKLHVRFLDEKGARLPSRDELGSFWINSYFLDSLRTVAMEVEGLKRG